MLESNGGDGGGGWTTEWRMRMSQLSRDFVLKRVKLDTLHVNRNRWHRICLSLTIFVDRLHDLHVWLFDFASQKCIRILFGFEIK